MYKLYIYSTHSYFSVHVPAIGLLHLFGVSTLHLQTTPGPRPVHYRWIGPPTLANTPGASKWFALPGPSRRASRRAVRELGSGSGSTVGHRVVLFPTRFGNGLYDVLLEVAAEFLAESIWSTHKY